jgi:hypothetical protein
MAYKPKVLAVADGGTGLAATTVSQILFSSAANIIAGLATNNNAILATNSSGVPSITTASGNWNNTSRSAFFVYLTTDVTNATGDGTAYTVIYDTKSFDQGNDFTLATGIFTAPVTGRYQFNCVLSYNPNASTVTVGTVVLVTTGLNIAMVRCNGAVDTVSPTSRSGSVICPMTAGDTAKIVTTLTGGTKTVTIVGATAGRPNTHFSGFLVC